MQNRDICSIFFNMEVNCVLSLESPILMSTHNIPFQYKKKNTLNYPKYAAVGFF